MRALRLVFLVAAVGAWGCGDDVSVGPDGGRDSGLDGSDGARPDTGGDPDSGSDAAVCTSAAECDDGVYCNGEELCELGACAPGTPVDVDDGVDCTVDRCDEDSMMPVHTPDDSACEGADRCMDGELTTGAAICNATTGCVSMSTEDCPSAASSCSSGLPITFTTYEPACSDETTCDPTGTPSETICPVPSPACVFGAHTTYEATCDAAAGGCGTRVDTEEDCTAMGGVTCSRGLRTTTCFCDDRSGCLCRTTVRVCTDPRCVGDATEVCTGCIGASCSGCRTTICLRGCDAATGTCI